MWVDKRACALDKGDHIRVTYFIECVEKCRFTACFIAGESRGAINYLCPVRFCDRGNAAGVSGDIHLIDLYRGHSTSDCPSDERHAVDGLEVLIEDAFRASPRGNNRHRAHAQSLAGRAISRPRVSPGLNRSGG